MARYFLISDEPLNAGASFARRSLGPLTTGGVRQSIFTLISAAIGGGTLCLPYVFSLTGLVLGILMICFAGFLAFISMRMLLVSAERLEVYSYGKLFSEGVNMRYSGICVDSVMILFGFGVVTAYFVFLGDFIPSLMVSVCSYSLSRELCIVICCIAAIPLAVPEKLSALQYITPLSTLSLIITSGVVAYRTPEMHSEIPSGSTELEILYFKNPYSVLKAFAIVTSAFICHTNVVSVAGELVSPTETRATKVAFRSALVQVILYLSIATCGYISFGGSIQQNFIKNYPADDPLISLCRVFLSLTIFFGLPINTNPTAKSFVSIYNSLNESSNSLDHMNRQLRIICGIALLILGASVSLVVPGIADVVSFIGGSLGALIMLVFPTLIYTSVFRTEMTGRFDKISVVLAIISAFLCLTYVFASVW